MEKLTTKQAIEKVMKRRTKPMSVAAIFEAAYPLTGLAGKTPKQTFYGVLYGEAQRQDGLVERVGKVSAAEKQPRNNSNRRHCRRRLQPRPSGNPGGPQRSRTNHERRMRRVTATLSDQPVRADHRDHLDGDRRRVLVAFDRRDRGPIRSDRRS